MSRDGKISRVGLLVKRIQESLANPMEPQRTDRRPSSLASLPETGGLHPVPVESSLRERHWVEDAGELHVDTEEPFCLNEIDANLVENLVSSDFGGDDLDMDMLQETGGTSDMPRGFESAPRVQVGTEDPVVLPSTWQDRRVGNTSQFLHTAGLGGSSKAPLAAIEEGFDEFGGDIDLSVEDLENVVSLFDSRPAASQHGPDLPVQESQGHSQVVRIGSQLHEARRGTPQQVVAVLSDDEFGGSDIDDEQFVNAEIAATQAYQASAVTQTPVILVEDERTGLSRAITLRQSWFDTHCMPGSYVHIIGTFTKTGQITIDDAANMLIVHPDHLISATVIADSFECLRRAVLQDRVKATSKVAKPTVYGSILHEIFQEAMKANCWDIEWLNALIDRTVVKYIDSIYELGMANTVEANEHLRSKMPELQAWANTYVREVPGRDALVDDRNGKKLHMSVNKLLDIEEHVWSPTYGLKGNIDATVQVRMQDEEGGRTLTVPFEVKTGKNTSNASHRAQTALYTLLLSDRYDVDVAYGVLYYLETSATSRIPAVRNELQHMVMQRNELASYVRERLQLPPMLQEPFKCGRCYAKTSCFIYHKLAEDGTSGTAGVKEKFDEVVRNLKPVHQDFFKKWDHLLTKEESELMKFRRELWTMLSQEREKIGRCFAEVVIEPGSAHEQADAGKINRYKYTFVKNNAAPDFSFNESQITAGEPIVISDEKGHFALANGYVVNVHKRRITVAVDRRLHNARRKLPDFDAERNQVFAGIMEVGKDDVKPYTRGVGNDETQILYRLDKDEFSNGMALVRNNILEIMDDSVYRSSELRSLIIEGTAPEFKPTASAYTLSGTLSQLQINSDQKSAIEKVMSAKDYALVLGMPGTGKTTTIAHIIRALVAKGKSVLLTSYTHTAVDNILLKIRDPGISILRLGAVAKVHPEVQGFANLAAVPKKTIEELEQMYMQPQVVATTCLGINHQIFHRRIFDYCIVDEASQITLPVCLGPIRMARTFVLVGDHNQLPPLVQNKEAQEGGLDVSLFKLLSETQPSSVVNLEHQYRMCEDIMLLSNTLIYNGRLKCGNDSVAERILQIPNPGGLQRYHYAALTESTQPQDICLGPAQTDCWLDNILNPKRKVVFANTDTMLPHARESAHGSRIVNATEATLTTQLVLSLLSLGIKAQDIGVITFYRSQLALLRHNIRSTSPLSGAAEIEMHTADKFQGRDKEVVVLSCVRSNEAGNVGDLLKDWRRVNVAFTRARTKLIVLGSAKTLRQNELLARFLGLVEDRAWRVDLPATATEGHAFQCGTQETTQTAPERPSGRERHVKLRSPRKSSSPKKREDPRRVMGAASGATLNGSPIKKASDGEIGMKVPEKAGKLSRKTVLGRNSVLQDIVNDAFGADLVE
ncbi:DNA replication endonuclease-helicase Dna2 [Elasticomyces elasticus]|nr:DNA replication endonuclease-helicase Dna2 [Elasticomyces elasticus]